MASASAAPTLVTAGPFDITFYNTGDSGDGSVGSQNWTSTQISDIVASINSWASVIPNTPGRQIKLHMFWSPLTGSTLGQTYSPQDGDGTASWTYAEHIWRDGVNYAGSGSYDVRMDFSTNVGWTFGAGAPTSSQYDFRSVVTHEIGHTLGFDSTYGVDSYDRFSYSGLSMWDRFLVDSAGNQPAKGGTGTPGNFDQADAPVYFAGWYAVSQHGDYVPVYAPTTYSSGSSLTHLDETYVSNALMGPSFGEGDMVRAPTAVEWAIMADLGWGVKSWTKGAGTLNWGDANWTPTGAPTAAWHVIFGNSGIATGDTIALGGNRTIKTLRIDSGVGFTIGAAANTLTLQDGNLLRTTTANVVQTIASPIVLGRDAVWDLYQPSSGPSGKLVLTGTLNSAYAFTKNGGGTLALANTANVGDLALNDGDLTLLAGGALSAKTLNGDGILNLEGGTLTLTNSNTLHLWGVRVGKETTASFTLPPGKTFWTDVFVTVGRDAGGNGTLVNQGTIKADTNLFVGVYSGSNGTFIQQTGPNPGDPAPVTTVSGNTAVSDQGGTGLLELKAGNYTTGALYVGWNENGTTPGGAGTLTQTGGTMQVNGVLQLAGAGTAGTYNLNGGTLLTSQLTRATGTGAGTAAFNMGGGTLKAAANLTTDVPMTLKPGGGTVDSNGFAVTLTSPVTGAGGLTKTGAGTLLLTSASNNYTGNTVVQSGTLQTSGGINLNAPTDDTVIGTADTTATLITAHVRQDTLTINAGSQVTIDGASTSVVNFLRISNGAGFAWDTAGGTLAPADVTGGNGAAAVPEPAAWLLLAVAGLVGLGVWRRV